MTIRTLIVDDEPLAREKLRGFLDGVEDFVVGERTQTPSIVWYRYNGKGWSRHIIDATRLKPEAEAELKVGGWLVSLGDKDTVFAEDVDDIWQQAVNKTGQSILRESLRIDRFPDASFN